MSASVAFASTPVSNGGVVTTASGSRQTPTNVVTITTGAATGTRIQRVDIAYAGANGAAGNCAVQLYLYDGATYFLVREVEVPSFTAAAGTGWSSSVRFPDGLLLPSTSWSLRATVNAAQIYSVLAQGGSL